MTITSNRWQYYTRVSFRCGIGVVAKYGVRLVCVLVICFENSEA